MKLTSCIYLTNLSIDQGQQGFFLTSSISAMYQNNGDEELNKLLQSFKSNPISMNTEHRLRINHTVKAINIRCNMSHSEAAVGSCTTCLTVQE